MSFTGNPVLVLFLPYSIDGLIGLLGLFDVHFLHLIPVFVKLKRTARIYPCRTVCFACMGFFSKSREDGSTLSYVVLMIAHAVDFYCNVLLIALILRMILSMFDPEGEGLILGFTDFLARPVLTISEKILALFKIGNSGPFDFSPTVAYMLVLILQALISPFLI